MYLIPSEDLTLDKREMHRVGVIEMLIVRALDLCVVKHREDLKIRDLLPEDLELQNWATPEESGLWITAHPKFPIGIYKVLQLNAYPSVHTLEFRKDCCVVAKVGIEGCYSGLPTLQRLQEALLDPRARQVMDRLTGDTPSNPLSFYSKMEGYFSEPIICDSNQHLEVIIHCHQKSSSDYLFIGGFIAEPLGCTIV